MPKYFVSSGCSYSDTHSTEFKLWNNFVAEYLDRELVQLGIGGVGNQFIAHSFINKIKELLDNDVPSEDIFGIVIPIILIIFGTMHVQARTDRLLKNNIIIRLNPCQTSFICP